MFKPGDRIICIKNKYTPFYLTLNKIYIVIDTSGIGGSIRVNDDTDRRHSAERFILLKEQRKQKLMKLNDEIYMQKKFLQ